MRGMKTNAGKKMHVMTLRLNEDEFRYCLYCRSQFENQTAQDGIRIILKEHQSEHWGSKQKRGRKL